MGILHRLDLLFFEEGPEDKFKPYMTSLLGACLELRDRGMAHCLFRVGLPYSLHHVR